MPPPLDLTGRVFGRLTVLGPGGRVKFGRRQRGWVCRCECGAELLVPQDRLPHRPTIPASHAVDACPACRGNPCVVCGTLVPLTGAGHGRRATCSPGCADARRRQVQRDCFRRRLAADPGLLARMRERRRQKAASDPGYAARLRERDRRRWERRKARMAADPGYAAAVRERANARYARHAAEIQADRRARVDAMTPAERQEWLARARAYVARWRRERLADLKADPDRYRRYRDVVNEYQRQYHAARSGPPVERVCVVCGSAFASRKYRVLCGADDCRAAYRRQKTAAYRGRNLFLELERELLRRRP